MKKTQFIELCSLVRHTLVPFLSIVLFVAMGITLYAGMTWTVSALQKHVAAALEEGNAYDLCVTSGLGLSDSDLSALRKMKGVSEVESGYVSYQTIQNGNDRYYCVVRSQTEKISTLDVVEGKLPSKVGEIALLQNCTQFCDYKVGDTVTFTADGADASTNEGMTYLKKRTYTITALVSSPDFLGKAQKSLSVNSDGKQITCVFYMPKDAFVPESFGGVHPYAYLTCNSLRAFDELSEEYSKATDNIYLTVEEAGETLATERYNSLKDDADAQISDAQEKLDSAKAKIDSGQAKISKGEKKLASKKSELAAGQDKIESATSTLSSKKKKAAAQFADAQTTLTEASVKLKQLKKQYADGKEEVDYYDSMSKSLSTLSEDTLADFNELQDEILDHMADKDFTEWLIGRCDEVNESTAQRVAAFKQEYSTRPKEIDAFLDGLALDFDSIDISQKAYENATALGVAADRIQSDVVEPGNKELATAKSTIKKLKKKISKGKAKLKSKRSAYKQKVAQAQQKIDAGKSKIAAGEEKIAAAASQLSEGKSTLASAKAKYESGQSELEAAKTQVNQIQFAGWEVTDRTDSYVSQLVDTTCQTLGSLRLTMASLFIIVGLLVCYSVMSRLVHERLAQLGTKKALGFSLFEVAREFLSYALLACVIGILLGTIIGAPVVELVLFPKTNQYMLSDPEVLFQFTDIIAVCLVEIVLICLSAWLACRSILKKNAVELLAGQKPSHAKHRFYEKLPFWNHLGMLTQTMINNCFNDKRRVFGTLIGVTGCTALIVCAVTLQGGIDASIDEQQNVIEQYDQVVYVSNDGDSASDGTLTVDDVIASKKYTSLTAMYGFQRVYLPDYSLTAATLIVPENMDELSNVMGIQMAKGGSLENDGVCISRALADHYSYKVGDKLLFEGADAQDMEVPVAGIFNYYGGTHVAIMSAKSYAKYFGEEPTYSVRLVASDTSATKLKAALSGASDYDCITDSRATTREISNSVNGLALTVVAIYIGISALVALFVLLNLNVMFISEKKRELIVMMVNGYEVKDAKRYVSRDTLIMNVIGMVIGCALGSVMGILAIRSLQNSRLIFIANVSPLAWLVGIVICAFFSFVVMRIALRRVDKFKITSIND